jgi:hypothetical protein
MKPVAVALSLLTIALNVLIPTLGYGQPLPSYPLPSYGASSSYEDGSKPIPVPPTSPMAQSAQHLRHVLGQQVRQAKTKVKTTATQTQQLVWFQHPVSQPAFAGQPPWVPAIGVFPVYKQGGQRAFRDVGDLVTQSISTQLGQALKETAVVGPVQWSSDNTTANLVDDALSALEADWRHYGQPSPVTAKALERSVTPMLSGKPPQRMVLVDTELDLTTPEQPATLKHRVRAYLQDSLPPQASYRLMARVWVVDAGPALPKVFGPTSVWVPVNGNNITGMTASVYTLEGTAQVFRQAADALAKETLRQLPSGWLAQPIAHSSITLPVSTPEGSLPPATAPHVLQTRF